MPAAGSAVTRKRTHSRATRAAVVALVLIPVVAVFGPLLLLTAAGAVVTTRRALGVVRQRRARLEVERATPDAIELFILLVHAGLTPVRAVRELASAAPEPTRAGFASVVHRLDRGEPFSDALLALPERLGPAMVPLIDLVASADRHGSPLGPMLESLAHEARSTRRRQHEADARRLPVRLSFPLVACTLPSFVLLAIAPALIAALSSISLSI
jgi:tight adherence protein C